jgi:hypothetical protein
MKQFSPRDLEQISAYLDGQLSQDDSARLASRLKTDPELRAVYEEMRQSQALLRKLPMRRAPRNFRLTAKMAGVKPPLPRIFPLFRLASAFAAILFFMGYALNLSAPLAAPMAAAPTGGYGGGVSEEQFAYNSAAEPTESPASKIAPPQQDTYGETPTQETMALSVPSTDEAPQPSLETLDTARSSAQFAPPPAPPVPPLPVPTAWLFGLLGVAVVSGTGAFFVRVRTEQAWNKANAAGPARLGTRDILFIILAIAAVVLLAVGVYWMSNGFSLQPTEAMAFPSGGPGGDKGILPVVAVQDIQFTPGAGSNFSAANAQGLITGLDFSPDALTEPTVLHFIPGLDTLAPDFVAYFPEHAFTLFPDGKSALLQTPLNVRMEYGEDVTSIANEDTLALYWWSGTEWVDAATTCSPVSTYIRVPETNQINVAVCQFGTFLLVAP